VPFAHCLDCGTSALVDPSGRCPEGHVVGAAGARVTAAIGSATPHPDEPQPWVRQVELDPAALDAARPAPRVARPLSVPATDQPVRTDRAAVSAAAEDLLRELHALGDLGGGPTPRPTATASTATPAATPAPRPVARASEVPPVASAAEVLTPPTDTAPAPIPPVTHPATPVTPAPVSTGVVSGTVPPVPTPSPAAATPAPPSSPEEATDLDELTSLAAAVRSFDDRADVAPPAPPAPRATRPAPAAATAGRDLFDVLDATDELPWSPPAAAVPPEPARPAPRPAAAAAVAFDEGDDLRRDALADVSELARHEVLAGVDPAVDGEVAGDEPPVAAVPQLDGLTFTAKGPKGGRVERRGGKRGLFRR
jgi:hypothetical protein